MIYVLCFQSRAEIFPVIYYLKSLWIAFADQKKLVDTSMFRQFRILLQHFSMFQQFYKNSGTTFYIEKCCIIQIKLTNCGIKARIPLGIMLLISISIVYQIPREKCSLVYAGEVDCIYFKT